jgi:hypothetical protein
MRKANNLDEAATLFGQSDEPVECTKDGADPITATSLAQAEEYFAA